MSWRNRISWRWIIRGTCLGLLGLCVGVWGLSYIYGAEIEHLGGSLVTVEVDKGIVSGRGQKPYGVSLAVRPTGWSVRRYRVTYRPRPSLPFDDFLGLAVDPRFTWTDWYVAIPFWLPASVLAFVSWMTWRKTGRGKMGRGFPVEPLASRQESDGG